jgi:integrase
MSSRLNPALAPAEPAPVEAKVAAVLSALARQIAQDPGLISRLQGSVDSPEAKRDDQGLSALPETQIADDDTDGVVPNPKGRHMPRYNGPYRHGDKWRILVREPGQRPTVQGTYDTEEAGRKALNRFRLEARKRSGLTVEQALDKYKERMRRNGLKEETVTTTSHRLGKIFEPVLGQVLSTITPKQARELFEGVSAWAVDTKRNALSELKTFCKRSDVEGWGEGGPFAEIKPEGKRRRGKAKLTKDEANKYSAKCLGLAGQPKYLEAAVAAVMPLMLGLRASEVIGRQVRDLDDGGTVLCVLRAKSQAGIRSLEIPAVLQPLLARLAQGKKPTDRIFEHDRTWLRKQVRRFCKLADVPVISTHGLRGTYADLALKAHATPLEVARSLGHENTIVTFNNYADRSIVDDQQRARVSAALAPN